MIEEGLVLVLSNVAGGRIYPITPKSPEFPYIRYQRINAQRSYGLEGTNLGPTEFSIQLDCMGKTYLSAKNLAESVMAVLSGYKGIWGDSICRLSTLENENDFSQQDGDDITHWVTQRYLIRTNDD